MSVLNYTKDNLYEEFYYSTVCHVCKMKDENLKTCSGCKIYRYCSVAHQKTHWKSHKQTCQLLRDFLIHSNQQNCFDMDSDSWLSTRLKIKIILQQGLQRDLLPSENQVWMFPRVCALCYKTNSNFLFDCTKCPAVSYCSVDHQFAHHEKHSKICDLIKLQYEFYCGRMKDCDQSHCLERNISLQVAKDVFISKASQQDILSKDLIDNMNFGERFSHVLTVINGLIICKLFDKLTSIINELVIHIVGVTYEWMNFDEYICELIFHWIPNLKKLRLVFVGPELMLDVKPEWQLCESCQGRKVKIEYNFESTLYSHYFCSKKFIPPDFIVIFNCGFHEMVNTDNDLWEDTLPLLLMPNIPLLLTSYTYDESVQDINRLKKIFKDTSSVHLLKECEENTYHSFLPLRDWVNTDEVYFKNYYYSLLKTASDDKKNFN